MVFEFNFSEKWFISLGMAAIANNMHAELYINIGHKKNPLRQS